DAMTLFAYLGALDFELPSPGSNGGSWRHGSTRASIHRRTLSSGARPRRSPKARTARSLDLWWGRMPIESDQTDRPRSQIPYSSQFIRRGSVTTGSASSISEMKSADSPVDGALAHVTTRT